MTAKELQELTEIRDRINALIEESRWLSPKEASEKTGLTERQLWYKAEKGEVAKRKVGYNIFYLI